MILRLRCCACDIKHNLGFHLQYVAQLCMGQLNRFLSQGHLFETHGSLYLLEADPIFTCSWLIHIPYSILNLLEGSQRMPRYKCSDPGFSKSVKCAWQVHTVSPFMAEREVPFLLSGFIFQIRDGPLSTQGYWLCNREAESGGGSLTRLWFSLHFPSKLFSSLPANLLQVYDMFAMFLLCALSDLAKLCMTYSRGPQLPGRCPLPGCGQFGTRLRKWHECTQLDSCEWQTGAHARECTASFAVELCAHVHACPSAHCSCDLVLLHPHPGHQVAKVGDHWFTG